MKKELDCSKFLFNFGSDLNTKNAIPAPNKSIIKQRQLGNDMLSFDAALRHVLRQDPNVIMVGEVRDLETMSATITLAETGHLVLATLHTHNASQTIDRIIDVFPPHQQTHQLDQF